MVEEVIAIARFSYTANQDTELTIHKNDRLVVLDSASCWWRVRNDNQLCGYVPSNYIEIDKYKESFVDKLFKKKKKKTSSTLPKPSNDLSPTAAPLNILATAKFKFEATREDELSFSRGDRLTVLEKKKDGWWKGEKEGKTGYFPSNYVSEGDLSTPTTPSQVNPPSFNLNQFSEHMFTGPPPVQSNNGVSTNQPSIFDPDDDWEFVCGVRAQDNCEAASPNDLSFVIGELMDIVRNPTEEPKWIARKSCGRIGYVLRHMVDVVPNAIPVYFNPKASPAQTPPKPPDFPCLTQQVERPGDNYVSPFAGKPWYFGVLSRRGCDSHLMETGEDGDFLVRDSESKIGDYSISLKASSKPKHFKVQLIDNQYAIGNRRFSTMEDIIRHYTHKSPIYTSPGGDERLFLVKPLEEAGSRLSQQQPRDSKKEYLCAWEK